eukprot:14003486-Heterocapsa_arctica.AAC.1
MQENITKAEFSAVGVAARRRLAEMLARLGGPGKVTARPKILGTRLQMECNTRPAEDEARRLQRASRLARWAASIPGTTQRRMRFVKGSAMA